MLPKTKKKDSVNEVKSEANRPSQKQLQGSQDTSLIIPQHSKPKEFKTPQFTDDSEIEVSDSPDSMDSVSSSDDSNYLREPQDLKKKYLIKAPLSFKINPPPKIVDLTSDFFEKDDDQVQTQVKPHSTTSKYAGQLGSPMKLKQARKRQVINNPKQNAVMIEVGKKKIGQLQKFHGKMISEVLLRDFEVLFAPLDETQDA